jgi:hypothetical protein
VFTRTDAVGIACEFLARVSRPERIRGAYLFGSTVWGRPRPYSDIDLVVLVEPTAGTDGGWTLHKRSTSSMRRRSSIPPWRSSATLPRSFGGGLGHWSAGSASRAWRCRCPPLRQFHKSRNQICPSHSSLVTRHSSFPTSLRNPRRGSAQGKQKQGPVALRVTMRKSTWETASRFTPPSRSCFRT